MRHRRRDPRLPRAVARHLLVVLVLVSSLYLLVSLGIGLVASATRSQFVASQIALLATFLPAMLLSGFLFDIRSMPVAIQYITMILPARYFVTLLRSDLSGRRHLGRHPAECSGARGHGCDSTRRGAARHAQAARLMRASLLRIVSLVRKELLALLRDPRTRFILFAPALLQSVIFGYAASFDLNHAPYVLLDEDHSTASRDLIAALDGSGVFQRVADVAVVSQLQDEIDSRDALVGVHIGPNFARDLAAGTPSEVQVIADGRNSNTAATALGYISAIVDGFNAKWRAENGVAGPPDHGRRAGLVQREPRDDLEHDPGR